MKEMDKSLKVKKVVVIHAGPDAVWSALTDKETIKKYFFGTEAISDWKVGSSLIFQGEWEGKTFQDKGNILAVEPEKLLKYNYWSGFSGLEDVPENYSLVTYRMTSEDNHTILKLTQEGFAGEEAKAHSESGWTMVLNNLKKLLE
jgi:uncharacterized protein YndB with AHSA1/START domain